MNNNFFIDVYVKLVNFNGHEHILFYSTVIYYVYGMVTGKSVDDWVCLSQFTFSYTYRL